MRIIDLAKRMGVTEGAVRDLEKAEVSDSITIGRLKRAASALDFELVYALVPRTSIEKTFTKQILRRARRDANRTAATMDLEGQGLPTEAVENLRQEFVLEYLRDPPKDLWRD